uniref:Uncharacterized protein n=1 Tax=Trichuris muris TaxID=70415 RepID=A0A5S6QFT6_TRIMR
MRFRLNSGDVPRLNFSSEGTRVENFREGPMLSFPTFAVQHVRLNPKGPISSSMFRKSNHSNRTKQSLASTTSLSAALRTET